MRKRILGIAGRGSSKCFLLVSLYSTTQPLIVSQGNRSAANGVKVLKHLTVGVPYLGKDVALGGRGNIPLELQGNALWQ